MKLREQLSPCGSTITVPGPDGDITYTCTRLREHGRNRFYGADSRKHCDTRTDDWRVWEDGGPVTPYAWAEPSPERTYRVRMSEDDWEGLKDFLEGPFAAMSDRKLELVERLSAALRAAERED